ncbi:Nlrc3, partial [Symbiodinium necroappetens]
CREIRQAQASHRGDNSEEFRKLFATGRGDGKEKFEKLFAPLCRALPELPTLRELLLWLGAHGGEFGPGPGADEARALAAGLGQQKELERLMLALSGNSLGRGPQLRSAFRYF